MAQGQDKLAGKGNGSTDPGVPFPITLSDTVDMTLTSRALVIAVGGTVTIDYINAAGGITSNVQFTYPAGVIPIRATRVYVTGTAATGISGIY